MWRRTSTISRPLPTVARIGLGFALAVLAQFLALLLAGAGHGWIAPFFLSVALWFLAPLTFAVAWPGSQGKRPLLFLLAAIAVAADALLIDRSLDEIPYIQRLIDVNGALSFTVIGLWLALWFCWQVVLLYSLVAKRAHD